MPLYDVLPLRSKATSLFKTFYFFWDTLVCLMMPTAALKTWCLTSGKFWDKTEVLVCFESIPQLDNVRVIQASMKLYLPLDCGNVFRCLVVLWNEFQGHRLSRWLVNTRMHLCQQGSWDFNQLLSKCKIHMQRSTDTRSSPSRSFLLLFFQALHTCPFC